MLFLHFAYDFSFNRTVEGDAVGIEEQLAQILGELPPRHF